MDPQVMEQRLMELSLAMVTDSPRGEELLAMAKFDVAPLALDALTQSAWALAG